MAAVNHAPHIHAHGPVPVFHRYLADIQTPGADPSVVDDQIHRAAQPVFGLLRQPLDLIQLRYITGIGDSVTAVATDGRRCGFGGNRIDIRTHHPAAAPRQLVGKSLTNTAAGTGYYCTGLAGTLL